MAVLFSNANYDKAIDRRCSHIFKPGALEGAEQEGYHLAPRTNIGTGMFPTAKTLRLLKRPTNN